MCQRPKPVAVHWAEPVSRDAKDVLFLFAVPGVGARLPRHAKDPVWFLSVTSHGPPPVQPELAGPSQLCTSMAGPHLHHARWLQDTA